MKHHNFKGKGICTNCGHDGELHYGYFYNHVVCWDVPGDCFCTVFEAHVEKKK